MSMYQSVVVSLPSAVVLLLSTAVSLGLVSIIFLMPIAFRITTGSPINSLPCVA